MLWNDVYVGGTGRFLPPLVDASSLLDNADEHVDPSALELSDYQSFSASPDLTAPQMAARAAAGALRHANCDNADVTMLIYAYFDEQEHLTPACHLQRVLSIPDAISVELGNASNGGAAAIEVAAGHVRIAPSGSAALVTAASRFQSPRWRRWHPALSSFLADGAAAVVLAKDGGFARLISTAHTSAPELEHLATITKDGKSSGPLLLMEENLEPHQATLARGMQDTASQALEEADIKPSDLTRMVVTGLGLAPLSALVLEPLGIPVDRTTWSLQRQLGHVGSCDQLIGLDHVIREESLRPGDTILVFGSGLGFRFTCAVLEITEQSTATTA
ncbi:ketoacyl-ACP synthase III family protein [Nocardia transvalensis]|uniref:ketoacyl-ACP synthase III family protein n=1 Tax=Nocardia transvalensis TaxID=37333 RepID=UPI0018957792|nr:ketoacyl-ACP synthase III family protein [Nocardia transvalensis]MBF6334106.1 ketoacyl-ACP synthase III family protein [Nocardia transvalensis]